MAVRFYIDPETGRPHVEGHGVSALECVEVLTRASQDFASVGDSRVAMGRTVGGRYLKVIYKPGRGSEPHFIITAYPLRGKELVAFRTRTRRRRS